MKFDVWEKIVTNSATSTKSSVLKMLRTVPPVWERYEFLTSSLSISFRIGAVDIIFRYWQVKR